MEKVLYKESDLPEKELMPGVWLRSIFHEDHLVTIVRFKPFAKVPEHGHDEEQITVVVEGKLDFIVGGERHTAHKGDVLVIPPRAIHEIEVSPRGAKVIDTWNHTISDYIVEEKPGLDVSETESVESSGSAEGELN